MADDKPKFAPSQVKKLNLDNEFQKLVSDDEELLRLFSSPDKTPEDQELELYSVLGGRFCIAGKIYLKTISVGIIALLNALDSPLVNVRKKVGEITVSDVDADLFVAANGRQSLEYGKISEIRHVSRGFCALMDVDPLETFGALKSVIKTSLAGWEYFPETNFVEDQPVSVFDAEWVTRQIRIVSEVSRYLPNQILWDVPMTTVSYLSVQFARKHGQMIQRPNKAKEAMDRLESMMESRIKEKGYK